MTHASSECPSIFSSLFRQCCRSLRTPMRRWAYLGLLFTGVMLLSAIDANAGTPLVMPPSPRLPAVVRTQMLRTAASLQHQDLQPMRDAGKAGQFNRIGKAPIRLMVSGTKNIPCLMIDFPDLAHTHQSSEFQTMLFTKGGIPTGTLQDYYLENSYGQFTPTGQVYGWYTAQNNKASYGIQNLSNKNMTNATQLVLEAIKAADTAGVDWTQFDNNHTGTVDNIVVVHSGSGAEETGSANDIWSHEWYLSSAGLGPFTTSTADPNHPGQKIKIDRYTIQPETSKYSGGNGTTTKIVGIGVFCHEMGHSLGLPDLYDTSGTGEGLGLASLMAGGSWGGDGNDSRYPSHLDAWSKADLGFVVPTTVTKNGTNTITCAETAASSYLVKPSGSALNEYFLVENREHHGFDLNLFATGLFIYHIDDGIITQTRSQNTINVNTHAYGVLLEEANATQDSYATLNLYVGKNQGTASDSWPNGAKNGFNETSVPSTKADDNSQQYCGITGISNKSDAMTAFMYVSQNAPALALTKSVSPTSALPGGVVTYTVNYNNNNGTLAASNVAVTDTLPANLTYQTGSATAGGNYNAATQTITWSIGALNINGSGSMTFAATVNNGVAAGTNISNTALISCTETPAVTSNAATVTVLAPPQPNLTLSKAVAPSSVPVGGSVTYTLNYANTGTAQATNVLVSDVIPANMTYVNGSVTGNGNYNAATQTVSWSLGTLAVNRSGSLTFKAMVNNGVAVGTNISNTALVSCTETAMVSSNAAVVTVAATPLPNLTLTKAVAPTSAQVGGAVTYTLSYANTGTVSASNVTVTDVIPANMTYVNGSVTGGGAYTAATQTLSWTVGTLIANGSGALTFKATVNNGVAVGTNISNTALISCTETAAVSSNAAIVTVSATPLPALTLTKAVAPTSAVPGGSVTYTLNYTNIGAVQATNVTVSDVIPANMTYAVGSATGGGNYNAATKTVNWSLGTVLANGSGSLTFRASVNNGVTAGTSISNTALVSCTETGAASSNAAVVTVAATPLPSLTLTKAVNPTSAMPGGTVTYTLTFTNAGAAPASNVTLTDVIPANMTFVNGSATGGGVYTAATKTISWTFGTQAINSTGSITFKTTVNNGVAAATTIDNTAAIACTETAAVTSNTATVTVTAAPQPVLTLTKAVAPTSAIPGGAVTYTLTYTNTGAANATNVTLTDVLPANMTFQNGTATGGGVYNVATRTLSWAIGALPFGRSGTMTFKASVNVGVAAGTLLNNTAAITCTETAAVTSNTATVSVAATPLPALTLTNAVTPSSAIPGGTVTYTLTYGNGGAANATNITLTNAIPANMTYLNGSATGGGVYNALTKTISWMLGTLAPNMTGIVTFKTIVNNGVNAGTTINDTAGITCTETTPVTSNTTVVTVAAVPLPTLTLTNAVAPASAAPGTTCTYTLNYTNIGTAKATTVTLTDALPANMTYVTGSVTGGAAYNVVTNTLTWMLGTLNVNAAGTFTFKATINNGVSGGTAITNTARVACNEIATVVSNNATVNVPVPPPTTLSLTKAVSPNIASPAGTVTYTLTYANTGASTASNLTITDVVPANMTYLNGTATGNGFYNVATNTLSWTLGTLRAGASGSVTFKTTIATNAQGGSTINNTAGATCIEAPAVVSNTVGVSLPVPGLTLAKTALPAIVRPGDTVTFTIVYRNTGVGSVNGVVMTDILPSNLTYINGSANNTPSYTPATHTLVWALGTVPSSGPSSSAQVTFKALVDTKAQLGTTLNNTATVTGTGITTPVTSNTTTTLVSAPSLAVTKTALPNATSPGGAVTFTISYANNGNWYASNAVITDKLPLHLTPVTGTYLGGVYNSAARTITWSLGTINAGANGSVSFKAIVDATTPVGTVLTNTASMQCGELTSAANGTATVTVSHPAGGRGDWWMFHHDPQHTGLSPFAGPAVPTQKWAFTAGGGFDNNSPAMGKDGTIYIACSDGNLYAVNPDGTQQWAFPTGGAIIGSPALATDGTIYIQSNDRYLYAINADGSQQWAFRLRTASQYSNPAVAADGTVYVGCTDGNLYAVNADGTLKWMFNTGGVIYSSPALGKDGTIYFGSNDKNFYAVTPNGTKKWSYTTGNTISGHPMIAPDGTIYIGSDDTKFYALTANGALRWSAVTGGAIRSTAALGADGSIYIRANDMKLYAFKADGTLQWTFFPAGKGVSSTPVVGSDGIIYIGGVNNNLYALKPDGTAKWNFATGGVASSPAIGPDGTLYCGSTDNNLYAISGWLQPQLTLTKTAQPTATRPGNTVTFILTYANTGTLAATNVVLTDVLPAHLTYLVGSATNAPNYNSTTGTLTWNLGTVPAGSPSVSYRMTFNALVDAATPANTQLTNTASIICDLIALPVTSTVTVAVSPPATPALTITKSATPANPKPGDTVTYTLTYGNTGTSAAANATITDVLPAHLTYVTGSAKGAVYNANTRTLTWTLGTLNVGAINQTLSFQATVDTNTPLGTVITNTATLAATGVTAVTSSQAAVTVSYGSGRGDWWMFHHDQEHTGCSKLSGPISPVLKWTFATGNPIGWSSPALGSDGTVYIGSSDKNVYAINPDGTQKWVFPTQCNVGSSPAIGIDGTVYICPNDLYLYAINPDGTQRWAFSIPINGQNNSSPAIGNDGTIYFESVFSILYAFNPDGTQKWNVDTGLASLSSPAIGVDGTIYIGSGNNNVIAFNPDGTKKWTYTTGGPVNTSPAIGSDGTIYVGSNDGNFYALYPNGTKKWSYSAGTAISMASPAIGSDGTIYISSDNYLLHALNSNGTEKWAFKAGSHLDSSPAIGADGTIYIGCQDKNMYAINADGTQKWTFATGNIIWSSPAIGADGTLYFGCSDNNLYAIGSNQPIPPSPLTLTKSALPTSARAGDVVTYTITYANTSSAKYTNAVLTDPLPTYLTYLQGSASNAPVYNAATRTLTWNLGTIPAGGQSVSYQITFRASVDANAPVDYQALNVATMTCTELPTTTSNTAITTILSTPTPALSLAKAAAPANPSPGSLVTYTLTYGNSGTAAASSTVLTDMLPATLTYVPGSATGAIYNAATRTLSWSLGTLAIGATGLTRTFTATLSPTAKIGTTVTNTASLTGFGLTPVTANAAFTVAASPITLVKSTVLSKVPQGHTVIYTLTYNNTGATPVTNAALVDVLPTQLTYVTGSASGGGSYNAATRALSWSLGTLNGNLGAQAVTFRAVVNTSTSVNTVITNTATLSCVEVPTVSSNAVAVTVLLGGAPGDWWTFHHDLKHTGRSAYNGPSSAKLKWAFGTRDQIWVSSPAIAADGTVYIGSHDKNLYAINPNGSNKWAFSTGGQIHSSSPAIGVDGTVYVGSQDNNVYAVNPDGTKQWSFTTKGNIHSSPAIGSDGTIYIGSDDNNLYALNPDGTQKWAFATNDNVFSFPAIAADGTIYVGSYDHSLYAINPDGTQKWAYATGDVIRSSPTIATDGTVYVHSWDGKLYAINPNSSLKWAIPVGTPQTTPGEYFSSPALGADGTIYLGSAGDSQLYAFTPAGVKKWSFDVNGSVVSSPCVGADGSIYIGSGNGTVYGVTASGAQKWAFATGAICHSSPAIAADGTLYIGSTNMNLYAITTAPPAPVLSLTKSVTPAKAWHGDKLTYTLVRGNAGNLSASGVTLTDVLPAHTTYVQGSALGAVYNPNTRTLTWQFGTLNAGTTAQATFQVTIDNAAATGSNIANSALIFCTQLPTPVTSNTANVTVTIPAGPGDWWMFHHDRQHTGRSPFNGPGTANKLWASSLGDIGWQNPAIGADGTLYVGVGNSLDAINPDGTQKWAFKTGGKIGSSAAVATDGTIYIPSAGGIYAVNPDGSQKWLYNAQVTQSSALIGTDGTVYVGSDDYNLYALNPNGTKKWSFAAGNHLLSSPAIAPDGTIYIGSNANNLYAITPNGTKKWSFATGGGISSSPAIAVDGTIYVGSSDRKLYAINPTGTQKWAFTTLSYMISSPAIGADGAIYVGSADRNLYAINPDGTAKWAQPIATGNEIITSPAIGADGTIYFASRDNNIYAVTADGYQRWSYLTGGQVESSPTIGSDGTLYIGSHDGNLYAISNGPPAPALGIKKSVTPSQAPQGAAVTYTLQYKNVGTAPATGVTIFDVMPAHLTYVTGSASNGGNYRATGLAWSLGTLNPGVGGQVTFQATINNDAATGSNINNTAIIYCTEIPVPQSSNTATVTVISNPPALGLDKRVTPSSAARGDIVTYTIVRKNTGGGAATNVTITDVMPAHMTYLPGSASDNGVYTAANNTLTWSLGALNAATTAQVSFQATIDNYAATGLSIVNIANISCTEMPVAVASNTATITVVVNQRGDWWMFHHDPQHTGRSVHIGPANPKIIWAFTTSGGMAAPPAISIDGSLYAGGSDNIMYALNQDGTQRWTFTLGGSMPYSPTAVATDGTVYVGATDSKIYAINQNGTLKWTYLTGGQLASPATIALDGTIYFGSTDHTLYVLHPDGSLKWSYTAGGAIRYASPCLGPDGTAYFGAEDGALYAVSATGALKWKYTTGAAIDCSPCIAPDRTVYVGSGDNSLYAINSADGTKKWSYATNGQVWSSPALATDGTVYVGSFDTKFYAFTPAGALKWAYSTGGAIYSSPAVDGNGVVYFGSNDKIAYALNPDGTKKWSMQFNALIQASPGIGPNGTIYLPSYDKNLYAIGNGTPAPALNLTKTVSPTSAPKGATVTYTFQYQNSGNATATNISLADALPYHTTYVTGSATGNGTYNAANRALLWSLSNLNAGASAQVTFQATINNDATTGMNINNTALIFCTEIPAAMSSNTATVTVIGANPSGRGDWWMFRHDLQHTGRSSFNGPSIGKLQWSFNAGGINGGIGSPAIGSDGAIYFGANDNNLYALNVDGTKRWTFTTSGGINSSVAIGADGTLYFGSQDNTFYAVNPDHTPKWSFATGGTVWSSAAIAADGTIYVGSSDHHLYALNPDGTKKWSLLTGAEVGSSPAIGTNGVIYVCSLDKNIYAINPNGTQLWRYTMGAATDGTPTIGADGTIYAGSFDKIVYAINPSGTLKWKFTTGAVAPQASIGPDGTIYINSDDSNVYALKPDGTLKWTFKSGGPVHSAPAISADGTIYLGSQDTNVYALNPDGSQKWKLSVGIDLGSSFAIAADGTLYVKSSIDMLYAIGN